MSIDLASLIVPETSDQVMTQALAIATAAGFPTTTQAWQAGTVPRTLLAVHSQAQADLTQTIAQVARGAFTDLAEGAWLDGLAQGFYRLSRFQAVAAQRQFALTCSGAAGPYPILPNQIVATTSDNAQWTNTTSGTIPSGGSVALTFTALVAGAAGNTPLPNSPISLQTALAGVTIANPPVIGTLTDITVPGSDTEGDVQLALRCVSRWSTLGSGSNTLAYIYYALAAGAASVVRVAVVTNDSIPGSVQVFVAPSGAAFVTTADLAKVQTILSIKAPLCVGVDAYAASAQNYAFSAIIQIKSAFLASSTALIYNNWAAYAASIPISGIISPNALIGCVEGVPGLKSVVLTDTLGTPLSQTDIQILPGFVAFILPPPPTVFVGV